MEHSTRLSDFLADDHEQRELLLCAEAVLAVFLTLPEPMVNGRRGFYLTCYDTAQNTYLQFPVGHIADIQDDEFGTKGEKFKALSLEKARRLASNLSKGHLRSQQSRNVAQHQYTGAVACDLWCADVPEVVMSVSGLLEPADEAVALAIPKKLGKVSDERVNAIAYSETEPNLTFVALIDALKRLGMI